MLARLSIWVSAFLFVLGGLWHAAEALPAADAHTDRFDLPLPAQGFAAEFGEATFANGTIPYFLSTNARIIGKTDKNPVASKRGG